MISQGLQKIWPHRKDYSLLHTFGATTDGLPYAFSVYDGRKIPYQREFDWRFTPPVRPLPMGCTGEAGAFAKGLEDGKLHNPAHLYDATPPGVDGLGRDIRAMLQTLINRGVDGDKALAYFNCYGSGKIDDFDAARLGLYVNQAERRSVIVGTWWYPEFLSPFYGKLPIPSFNTNTASLHCYLVVGWEGENLLIIPWLGNDYALNGIAKMPRFLYNSLMAQPYTGAFTITDKPSSTPLPVGWQAIIDHVVAFLRQNIFHL